LKERSKSKSGMTISILNKIAVVLVILSFVLYGLIAVVPFLRLTISQKALSVSALMISGEIAWWIGVAIVGKQVVMKYKKYLNPCSWCSFKRSNSEK